MNMGTPIGKATGLIAGVLGQLATNSLYFPIGFVKWPDMPNSFLDRVFDEIIMVLCKKNKLARQKQIPHTCGAKSLARRRAEMKAKGKDVDRVQMWTETHKRKDESYVTEEAKKIGERIQEIRSERPESLADVSPNDALSVVLGPEHAGHVRGLGLGVVPTMAFKQTFRRIDRVNLGSSSTGTPTPQWQKEVTSMRSMHYLAYIKGT